MYEVLYYIGLILSIIFFLLSVFLFFYNKIISVIKNMAGSKIPGKYTKKRKNALISRPIEVNSGVGGATEVLANSLEPTEQLTEEYYDKVHRADDTEILDIAQNFATALLDADKTEILPRLDK